MRGDPVSGEKSGKPDGTAEQKRAFGDDFRDRPAQRGTHDQQGDNSRREKENERMREEVVTQRPALAEQTKGNSADQHRSVPINLRARERRAFESRCHLLRLAESFASLPLL